MDRGFDDLYFSVDDFNIHDPNQSPNFANGFRTYESVLGMDPFAVPLVSTMPDDVNNMPALSDGESVFPGEPNGGSSDPSVSLGTCFDSGGESLSSLYDSLDPALRYINEMLMEENMEGPVVFAGSSALRNTEKSLYGMLGEQYPGSPDQYQTFDETQSIGGLNSNSTETIVTSTNSSNSIDPNVLVESSVLSTNILNENYYSVMQFKRGLEEANKFLPSRSQLVINFENVISSGSVAKSEGALRGYRGKKNHEREDLVLVEGMRAIKQTASSTEVEEAELSELFDKVLLCDEKLEPEYYTGSRPSKDASNDLPTRSPPLGSHGGRVRGRRPMKSSSVDLRALLIQCAQAVSSNDLRTANELLKQIRANSSPSGDGSQRLAHYFANGLQARMEGNHGDTQCFYDSVASNRISAADMLKAIQLHISVCPFMRISVLYADYMIWKLLRKAGVLHIIEFGVNFGFRWPLLIQKLGEQADGPKKLRITGIEFPQPGFRPAERIEEAGRRLARYCERFNVPFEFNALPSSNWETIKIEDLKIKSGEMIAVSSLGRFRNLLDESVEEGSSPRDSVLNLIRRIKPDVFVNVVWNVYFDLPFFVTRFREALFYFSSIYDMLDATITGELKDCEERRVIESEFFGRMIMNVVACEGPERVERPEKYKQWQLRLVRAGFKQVPLDQAATRMLRRKLEAWYHKDFGLGEDGNWMLEGWKGRVMHAASCWVTA